MSIKIVREWILPIISILLGFLGLYSLFFPSGAINYLDNIVIISILLIILLIAVILYINKMITQESYTLLSDYNSIKKRITSYSNDINFPNIFLLGKFNEDIVNIMYGTFGENNSSKSLRFISTNPNDYNNWSVNLKKSIFESEVTEDDSAFLHRFYHENQIVSIFIAYNINKKPRTILFWKTDSNVGEHYQGVEIKNEKIILNLDDVFKNSFSMNIEGNQDSGVSDTVDDIVGYWKSQKEGFYMPIIPPASNPIIRKEWRELILKYFNNFALSLLNDARYEKMEITWNISLNSLRDFDNFKEWIDNQFEITKKSSMTITRYILIDSTLYNNSDEYKQIVEILSKYLEDKTKDSNGNYILKYIDSLCLPKKTKNDFALLTGNSSEIVQSTIIDNSTTPEVLKVYFSKDYNSVNNVKKQFNNLSECKMQSSLTDFIGTISA